MKDKKVGDTVFLVKSDRRNSRQDGEYYITKIGTKFITICKNKDGNSSPYKVDKNPFNSFYHLTVQNWGGSDSVFPDEQTYNDYRKADKISRAVSDLFKWGNITYSLTQLEEVAKILGIETE